MNPAEAPLSSEKRPGLEGAVDEHLALHMQQIGETVVSLRSRTAGLEARRKHETSQRIGVGWRAAELGDLIDRSLKPLERPDAPPVEVFHTPIPKRGARERPVTWTIGLTITLFVTLTAFWALRSTPVTGPALRRLPSPVTYTIAGPASPAARHHAERASAAPDDASRAGDDTASPPAAHNSPVFELYSPKAPATPPH
jgi:hypothetical protein